MITLREKDLIDPETDIHYAYHKTLNTVTGMHDHDFYEIFLISGGGLCHIVGGRRTTLEEGTLVLIRPRDVHYYEASGGSHGELINLAFPERTLSAILDYLGSGIDLEGMLAAEAPPSLALKRTQTDMLVTRFQELTLIPASQKPRIKANARALLADLFMRYFSKRAPEEMPLERPEWLSDLMQAMKKKDHFTAGLPKMHELSPKSPEHLSRMFKRYVGVTPTRWINEVRLQYAANLLTMTDEPVLSVCYECGFENLSHFNHQFKRQFHLTPSRYRIENQKLVIPG